MNPNENEPPPLHFVMETDLVSKMLYRKIQEDAQCPKYSQACNMSKMCLKIETINSRQNNNNKKLN
jgi:hypothetical protein